MRLSTFDCQIVDGIYQSDHYKVRASGQIARLTKSEGPGGEGRRASRPLNQSLSEGRVQSLLRFMVGYQGFMKLHEKVTWRRS